MTAPVNTNDCRWAWARRDDLTLCRCPTVQAGWCECSAACPCYEPPPPSVTAAQAAAGITETEAYDGYVSYAHHEYAGQWGENRPEGAEPTEKGLSRMDIEQIVLGGEWVGGRREYAPGLVGAADASGSWGLRCTGISNSPWLAQPQAPIVNCWTEYNRTADSADFLRLAESACDHAARVFLAGCCAYAEWVREWTTAAWRGADLPPIALLPDEVADLIETVLRSLALTPYVAEVRETTVRYLRERAAATRSVIVRCPACQVTCNTCPVAERGIVFGADGKPLAISAEPRREQTGGEGV